MLRCRVDESETGCVLVLWGEAEALACLAHKFRELARGAAPELTLDLPPIRLDLYVGPGSKEDRIEQVDNHTFEWTCEPEGWLEAAEKVDPLVGKASGWNEFYGYASDLTIVISADGKY